MRSGKLVEFTGERVVPGLVNDNLWAEHFSRYSFAKHYATDKRVLDAGCGTGYGAHELARVARSVTAFDASTEAVDYASAHYKDHNIRFLAADCAAFPFAQNSFDLIVAFEVIEHLSRYREFLAECGRTLSHQGLLIVSSPNRLYYAESRATTGPNPYHEHEFEAGEFLAELNQVFSNVRLLLQNRVEAFAFHGEQSIWPADAALDRSAGEAKDAHFFIGLCSFGPLPEPRSFVYVPHTANLLRERERHIGLLETELDRSKQWLAETQSERDALLELHRQMKDDLEARNRWAEQLNERLQSAAARIVALQGEAESLTAGYEAKIKSLEEESVATANWAADASRELQSKCEELAVSVSLLEAAEATVVERTEWAQRLDAERQQLAHQLELIRSSRWLKLSRKLGLGPQLQASDSGQ